MREQLYIDGVNVCDRYGIQLMEGSYKSIVQYPTLKTTKEMDWAEFDGKEFDLSDPKLNSREISISFAYFGESSVGEFIEMLYSEPAHAVIEISNEGEVVDSAEIVYHTFEFKELKRTYKLRLVDHSNLETYKNIGKFTLKFAEDSPMQGYKYLEPKSNYDTTQGYEISYTIRDNTIHQDITITNSLSKYGVYILSGTDNITKSSPVKQNLLRSINSQSGAMYDGKQVTFATKDVTLECFMRADSLDELWRNYDALLFDLARPKERRLYVDETGTEYGCHYKSSTTIECYVKPTILFKFSLILLFNSFRVGTEEFLLATEFGNVIVTEDGSEIDVKYIRS